MCGHSLFLASANERTEDILKVGVFLFFFCFLFFVFFVVFFCFCCCCCFLLMALNSKLRSGIEYTPTSGLNLVGLIKSY